jgi:hypothetical protein
MVHLHKKLTQAPAKRMPLRRDNHASIEKA